MHQTAVPTDLTQRTVGYASAHLGRSWHSRRRDVAVLGHLISPPCTVAVTDDEHGCLIARRRHLVVVDRRPVERRTGGADVSSSLIEPGLPQNAVAKIGTN